MSYGFVYLAAAELDVIAPICNSHLSWCKYTDSLLFSNIRAKKSVNLSLATIPGYIEKKIR